MARRKTQPNKSSRKRILVVDDHAVLREGLITQINREADLVVCGETENAREALAAIFRICLVVSQFATKRECGKMWRL